MVPSGGPGTSTASATTAQYIGDPGALMATLLSSGWPKNAEHLWQPGIEWLRCLGHLQLAKADELDGGMHSLSLS